MSSSDDSSREEVDFDKYRKVYESDEHFKMRKAFLTTHWEKFEEEEILCLAQVFVNVELMGCRYPAETMLQVAQLSSEVPTIQRYRQSRRNRLQRTFVGAQDAVQAKLQKTSAPRRLENETWTKTEKKKGFKESHMPMETEDFTESEKVMLREAPIIKFNETQKNDNLRDLLKDVIYFEQPNDPNGSLNKTTSMMQKAGKLTMSFEAATKKYFYIYDDQIVGEGNGESKKIAKKYADEDLVKTLKANCYTIKNKLDFYSPESVITPKAQNEGKPSTATNKIQENNIGFKMLKMLGWSGGSLGSKNEGIVDPVNLEIKIGRRGLGSDDSEQFNSQFIRNLLRNFKNNPVEYDLVFSSEFTKEERASIHMIAQSLDLRTKSFGKNNSRHIVISTKLSPQALRQKLIDGDPHLLEKYEIIPPPPKQKAKVKKPGKKQQNKNLRVYN